MNLKDFEIQSLKERLKKWNVFFVIQK
jgi:hypothetical protein